MKFRAYALNMREEDRELIRRVGKVLTQDVIDIKDISKHNIESESEDVLILFGDRAQKASEGKQYLAKLNLPEIEKLDKEFGDPEERAAANAAVKAFKGRLDSKSFVENIKQITKINSVELTEAQTPTASQSQDKDKVEAIIGTASDGKIIKLSEEPETNTADVNLTFAEFMALDRFMTVFGVKETKLVYKPSASIRKSSTS